MPHISDFLVIGSGAAGLSFALRAAEHGLVTVLTKKERADSNTNYAQGGIASVFAPDDSFQQHIEDTLRVGVGLSNPEAVEIADAGNGDPLLCDDLRHEVDGAKYWMRGLEGPGLTREQRRVYRKVGRGEGNKTSPDLRPEPYDISLIVSGEVAPDCGCDHTTCEELGIEDNTIAVLAVMHLQRNPDYWKVRLR